MVTNKPLGPLIVIVGETASGKSDTAIKIAEKFNGEIVVADSWTVYKGFDIGTAKPSIADRAKIRHHLIDIAEAEDGFNAAQFKELAQESISDISNRGKLPILVGGTGLYIDSVLFDFSFLPAGPLTDRQRYNDMSLEDLIKLAELRELDLSDIDLRNKRRVIRLIENEGVRPSKSSVRENSLVVGLQVDREQLTENISKRVDEMIDEGLVEEVKELSSRYGWEVEPMKGIGYRELKSYLENSKNLEEAKQDIIKNTLNLAKKQRTWFKRNEHIKWTENSSQIVDITTIFLNKF
jgi:tRNA dimethylallyltransferase